MIDISGLLSLIAPSGMPSRRMSVTWKSSFVKSIWAVPENDSLVVIDDEARIGSCPRS